MDNEQFYNEVSAIRDLIKDKKNWTQNANARDKEGKPVRFNNSTSNDPDAYSFCLVGAFYKIKSPQNIITFLHENLKEKTGFDSFIEFNDSSSHEEVINFLDLVLKECNHG